MCVERLAARPDDHPDARSRSPQPTVPIARRAAASKPREGKGGNEQSELSSSPRLMSDPSPPSPGRLARQASSGRTGWANP